MSMQELKTGVRNAAAVKHLVALGVFPPRFTGQDNRSLSLFVIDGKGVLWEDAKKLADERGWKIRIIGIEEGEWGLDLCDGQEPEAIIAAIEDGAKQMSGGGGAEANPIFRKMGLQIYRACLKLARVYELTDDGFDIVKSKKERLYSLSFAYELSQSVLDPAGKLFKVVESIHKAAVNPQNVKNIAPLLTPDLWADIAFLRHSLLKSYPHDTVGSFLVNITEMLSPFVTNPAVRSRFGAARGNQLEIDDIWEDKTVTCFRLSPTSAVGATARLIGILTMIRIFGRASVRQLIQKDVGTKAKLGIVMDEAQELISTGIWGLSATTAWTRSAGLSVAVATQGLDGLIERIGEAGTLTLMNNLRTKVFLQTEAQRDQDFVIRLGAEVWRSMVAAPGEHESWHARLMKENGGIMDDSVKSMADDAVDFSLSTSDVYGAPQEVRATPVSVVQLDKHDMLNDLADLARKSKFVQGEDPTGGKSAAADATAEYQWKKTLHDMQNRQEDQTRAYFTHGWEKRSLWTRTDVSKLGMGQAIVFVNRAGVLRTDKIDVNPDLATPMAKRQDVIDVAARVVKPAGAPVAQIAQSAADTVMARRASLSADKRPVGVPRV